MINWQKDFNTKFMSTLNRLEKNQLCCLKSLTKVFTKNSSSISFSGAGTQDDPLIATSNSGFNVGLGSYKIPVFNDTFNRSSLGSNYIQNTPGYTVTFPSSSYMNVVGTGGSNIFVRYNYYTAAENFTIECRYRNNTIDSTTNGIQLGLIATHPLGASVSFYMTFYQNTGNSNLGKINILGSITSSASLPQPSVGDIIKLTVQRTRDRYSCTVLNETTGGSINYIAFGSANGGFYLNNTSSPTINFLGGDIDILDFNYSINEYKSPEVSIIGDSIAAGGGTTSLINKYPDKLYGPFRFVVNLNGNADYSYVILQRVQEVLLLQPKRVYLMFGGNDLLFGVPLSTLQSNYTTFVNTLTSAGILVYHLLSTPRNSTDVSGFNAWLKTTYPNTYIDTFTPLWNRTEGSTGLNSIYNSGDGLHPNDLGHAQIAAAIQYSGYLPF